MRRAHKANPAQHPCRAHLPGILWSAAWLTIWKAGEVQTVGCGIHDPTSPTPNLSGTSLERFRVSFERSPGGSSSRGWFRSVNTSGPLLGAPSLGCVCFPFGKDMLEKDSRSPTLLLSLFFSISGFHQKVWSFKKGFMLACSHSFINSLTNVLWVDTVSILCLSVRKDGTTLSLPVRHMQITKGATVVQVQPWMEIQEAFGKRHPTSARRTGQASAEAGSALSTEHGLEMEENLPIDFHSFQLWREFY